MWQRDPLFPESCVFDLISLILFHLTHILPPALVAAEHIIGPLMVDDIP